MDEACLILTPYTSGPGYARADLWGPSPSALDHEKPHLDMRLDRSAHGPTGYHLASPALATPSPRSVGGATEKPLDDARSSVRRETLKRRYCNQQR